MDMELSPLFGFTADQVARWGRKLSKWRPVAIGDNVITGVVAHLVDVVLLPGIWHTVPGKYSEAEIFNLFVSIVEVGGGSICTYHPAAPGSNPEHQSKPQLC